MYLYLAFHSPMFRIFVPIVIALSLLISPQSRLTVAADGQATANSSASKKPEVAVSFTNLGAVPQVLARPAELADELNLQEWCVARAAASGRTWYEPPKGIDPQSWLSVVVVGFGEQAHAYGFTFDTKTGTIQLPARVSHRRQMVRGQLTWTSPYSKLLGGFRVAKEQPTSPSPRPILKIEYAEASGAKNVAAPKSTSPKNSLDEALTLSPEKVLPPLQAIFAAAAYDAGWAPMIATDSTSAKALGAKDSAVARVEIGVLDQAASFRISLKKDGRESSLVKDRIPWEEYHEQLVHLLRLPLVDSSLRDFVRLHHSGADLLAAQENRIACIVDDELSAIDAATGLEAWRVRIPQSKLPTVPKKIEQYVARVDEQGRARLFRWTKSLSEFSWQDGQEIKIAAVAASNPWSFDVAANGAATVVSGSKLVFSTGGKEAWSVQEKLPISCGPLVEIDRVIFGTEKGELVACDAADGKVAWRKTIAPRLHGSIVRAGDLRLLFSNEEETLHAVAAADGSKKWNLSVGDVLAFSPRVVGQQVFVVTKQNRLLAVNRTDGKVIADIQWPTWLVAAQLVSIGKETRLVVSDVAGRVAMLDDSLKTTWQDRLPRRRTGSLAVLTMPVQWQAAKKSDPDDILSAIQSEKTDRQPMLLTTDAAGFLDKLLFASGSATKK